MASWLSIVPYGLGQFVAGSTIDAIQDDIIILGLHSHSGSAGDGSATLSPCAQISTSGFVKPHQAVYPPIPVIFPASHLNWGRVEVYNANYEPTNAIHVHSSQISNTASTASGASIGYIFYYSASTDADSDVDIRITFGRNPSGGFVRGYINGASSGSIDTSIDLVHTTRTMTLNNILTGSTSGASFVLILEVDGKNASSAGYGSSLLGFEINVD